MSNTATAYGGGLAAYGAMLVLTSTIAGNMASDGGGLAAHAFGSTLRITNSTLSANRATTKGGAIASMGSLTVSFSTIRANSAPAGGGIFALAGSTATLNATILAGNMAPSGPDCAGTGTVTSLGNNLIGDADGCSGFSAAGDLTGSGASPLNPHLGPLADNGGPTWTMAPQPGSPALDAVPLANCSVRADQRGQPRPDPLYNGACDIGVVRPRAVRWKATFHHSLRNGVSASFTFPTIWVHIWSVAQVSFHSA